MSLNVMLGSPATTKHSLPKTFCDIRMELGEMMLAWFKNWPDLLKNILWSAEAVFHISGFVNRHNGHYWVGEDPSATNKKCRIEPR